MKTFGGDNFIYLQRTHRVTESTIKKLSDIIWVDIWQYGVPDNHPETWCVNVNASKTKFECYWCGNKVKILGYESRIGTNNMLNICAHLVALGIPLERFHIHGSTKYNDDKSLQSAIKDMVAKEGYSSIVRDMEENGKRKVKLTAEGYKLIKEARKEGLI